MTMAELTIYFVDISLIDTDRFGDNFNSLPRAIQAHVGVYTDANARMLSVCGMLLAGEVL